MKLRLTAKIQNAGGVKEVYDYVVKGKGREEWRDEYQWIGDFHDGFAVVKRKGKFGIVDELGREAIPPKYTQINNLDYGFGWGFDNNGLAAVQLDGMWGMINMDGKVVVPIEYDEIGGNWHQGAWVILNTNRGILKPNGKIFFQN